MGASAPSLIRKARASISAHLEGTHALGYSRYFQWGAAKAERLTPHNDSLVILGC